MDSHLICYLLLGVCIIYTVRCLDYNNKNSALQCNKVSAAKLLQELLSESKEQDPRILLQSLLRTQGTAVSKSQPPASASQIQEFVNDETTENDDKRYLSKIQRFGDRKSTKSKSRSVNWQLYLLKRRRPWLLLPNRRCYRQHCESPQDCCRHHNICDKSAKVCYDCWYGYPCRTSADCCLRYPRCISSVAGKQGRCSN